MSRRFQDIGVDSRSRIPVKKPQVSAYSVWFFKSSEHTLWTLSFSMTTRERRVSNCSGSDMVLLKVRKFELGQEKKNLE